MLVGDSRICYLDIKYTLDNYEIYHAQKKQQLLAHSVIFLGEMQTTFYCQNVGTIVILDKKMFKFVCHMIGSNPGFSFGYLSTIQRF